MAVGLGILDIGGGRAQGAVEHGSAELLVRPTHGEPAQLTALAHHPTTTILFSSSNVVGGEEASSGAESMC
jgi:hypothetical protein